ncbi:hypothetical protein FQN60_000323 [Etheostoma spectabile]|uniref:Uncharacterized protein n=1 Tax=Etheostoma spectabile TaxID=54343 RepID=A0A5J5CXT2_9PERO|nr:hypothetical protein FQN60_000323 [Etheostoma spectabile]
MQYLVALETGVRGGVGPRRTGGVIDLPHYYIQSFHFLSFPHVSSVFPSIPRHLTATPTCTPASTSLTCSTWPSPSSISPTHLLPLPSPDPPGAPGLSVSSAAGWRAEMKGNKKRQKNMKTFARDEGKQGWLLAKVGESIFSSLNAPYETNEAAALARPVGALSHCEHWPSGSKVTDAVAEVKRKDTTRSFVTGDETSCEHSLRGREIKADEIKEERSLWATFPGAMATADCFNRSLWHRETRGGEGRDDEDERTARGGGASLKSLYASLESLYASLEPLCSTSEPESLVVDPGLSAGHGSHRSGSLDRTGPRRAEVVVVQVHVGQEVTQGVPALGRWQANQGGVTSVGEHGPHWRLAGLGCEHWSRILVFPQRRGRSWCGSERGGLQVGAPPQVGQYFTVGRRRVLHQNRLLIAGRLPEYADDSAPILINICRNVAQALCFCFYRNSTRRFLAEALLEKSKETATSCQGSFKYPSAEPHGTDGGSQGLALKRQPALHHPRLSGSCHHGTLRGNAAWQQGGRSWEAKCLKQI